MKNLILITILFLIAACSASNIEKRENQNSVLFDSLSSNYGFTYQYIIRVKILDNEADADSFINGHSSQINFNLVKKFDSNKNQYLIESEIYNSRFKAEEIISNLKLNNDYSDAALIIRKIEISDDVKDRNSLKKS
ncbi:MAG: hypothetical protein HND52_20360 [Ignavibacteriae bacterium]|nr:hypothetical protein [Ignavibacteriota bacterium]NOH00325.1 hypothetical protein [Ignavibacteriota bacterium]